MAGFFKVTAISPCLVQKDLDLVCQHFSDTVVYAVVSSVSLKINFKADLKIFFFSLTKTAMLLIKCSAN